MGRLMLISEKQLNKEEIEEKLLDLYFKEEVSVDITDDILESYNTKNVLYVIDEETKKPVYHFETAYAATIQKQRDKLLQNGNFDKLITTPQYNMIDVKDLLTLEEYIDKIYQPNTYEKIYYDAETQTYHKNTIHKTISDLRIDKEYQQLVLMEEFIISSELQRGVWDIVTGVKEAETDYEHTMTDWIMKDDNTINSIIKVYKTPDHYQFVSSPFKSCEYVVLKDGTIFNDSQLRFLGNIYPYDISKAAVEHSFCVNCAKAEDWIYFIEFSQY